MSDGSDQDGGDGEGSDETDDSYWATEHALHCRHGPLPCAKETFGVSYEACSRRP
jgi:hypothetical protein